MDFLTSTVLENHVSWRTRTPDRGLPIEAPGKTASCGVCDPFKNTGFAGDINAGIWINCEIHPNRSD
jgi:hypothetical protein